MATITAPKAWSARKHTALHTVDYMEYGKLSAYYQRQVDKMVDELGVAPSTITARQWEDVRFNQWCDEQSFECMA